METADWSSTEQVAVDAVMSSDIVTGTELICAHSSGDLAEVVGVAGPVEAKISIGVLLALALVLSASLPADVECAVGESARAEQDMGEGQQYELLRRATLAELGDEDETVDKWGGEFGSELSDSVVANCVGVCTDGRGVLRGRPRGRPVGWCRDLGGDELRMESDLWKCDVPVGNKIEVDVQDR